MPNPNFRLKASVAQEKAVARDIGGRRVSGSGSQQFNKGDVQADKWLIEAKQTVTGRFTLSLALWNKIRSEAIRKSKEPAMVIEMEGRKLVVLDYQTFLALSAGV